MGGELDEEVRGRFSSRELGALGEAGIALFAGRIVLEAQPAIDDATLGAVADRCAGPLPDPLIALWRNTFGGTIDYDLRADLDGDDAPVSFTELFYPDSGGYRDLWGWIDHECGLAEEHQPDWSGRLIHLPIGGFEYLERIYLNTAPGQDYGSVVYWRHGLPPGWELNSADRAGPLADSLGSLFSQLMLEQDPWEAEDGDSGEAMRDAIDELADSGDSHARSAASKLRHLAKATVLDWRGALEQGTIGGHRRLRRLALDRAAAGDDVAMLARLRTLGCDPAEQVRNGLTPIDVALIHRSFDAVRWLLQQGVPLENALQVGAHAVDLELARELLSRGASVNVFAITRAVDNEDVEVVHLLSQALRPDSAVDDGLASRLSMMATQAEIASARGDAATAAREQRRSAILAELAHRFGPAGRT